MLESDEELGLSCCACVHNIAYVRHNEAVAYCTSIQVAYSLYIATWNTLPFTLLATTFNPKFYRCMTRAHTY